MKYIIHYPLIVEGGVINHFSTLVGNPQSWTKNHTKRNSDDEIWTLEKLLSPGRQLLATSFPEARAVDIPQVEAAHAVDFQVAVILLQKQQENLKNLNDL